MNPTERADAPSKESTTGVSADCRSEEGDTVSLIDAMITLARVLSTRDLGGTAIAKALVDLRADEDIARLIGPPKPIGDIMAVFICPWPGGGFFVRLPHRDGGYPGGQEIGRGKWHFLIREDAVFAITLAAEKKTNP